jgi:DNA-directed RNA polymerase beta subunit
MNVRDNEVFFTKKVIECETYSSLLFNSFLQTNHLLLNLWIKTNPLLRDYLHKRRLSAGTWKFYLEKERFEVRDVHYTHYGGAL